MTKYHLSKLMAKKISNSLQAKDNNSGQLENNYQKY